MKEIKAYVRVSVLNEVVQALESAGYKSMIIIDVSALGSLADPKESAYSIEFVQKYSKVARIELVCDNSDAEQVVEIIKARGCTHQHGDGIIFVSDIERAIKIRTGEQGEKVLQN